MILGVAQQVLPMFYVTPPYPRFCRRFTGPLILIALIAAAPLMMAGYEIIAQIGVALGLLMLGGTTLLKIHQRKRKVSDASLRYWQLSMASLLLSLPLLFIAHPLATGAMAALFIGGFVLGLMNGMLYKIVPFLSWFHLSASMRPDIPMMHDFVAKKAVYRQLYLHSAAIGTLLAGLLVPPLVPIGALLLIAAYGLLGAHLIGALRLYRRHGGAL